VTVLDEAITRHVSAAGPLVLAVSLLCLVHGAGPGPTATALIGLAVMAGALCYLAAPALAYLAGPVSILVAVQRADHALCWHWTAPRPTGAPYGPVSGQGGR
jgi:hypothetical protein